MPGITRIKIKSDWNDWRTQMEDELTPAANELYRFIFEKKLIPLQEGDEEVECTKEEAIARYDWREGIDIILKFIDGTKATMQSKFLTFAGDTATFEEKKSSGKDGFWYYGSPQYYFVGYARNYKDKKILEFDNWILLDYPAIHRADARGEIEWWFNHNQHDNRRAEFRYVFFCKIPVNCIIYSLKDLVKELSLCTPSELYY